MTLRQFHEDAVLDAGDAARGRRAPGILPSQVSLAIDCLDFAPAAGSTR